jgi:hypothetical protein
VSSLRQQIDGSSEISQYILLLLEMREEIEGRSEKKPRQIGTPSELKEEKWRN